MEDSKKNPSFFKELGGFMKPYSGMYGLSVIISIAGVAGKLGAYAFAGLAAATLFTGGSPWMYVAGAAAGLMISALCLNTSTWCSHRAAYRTLKDLRRALTAKMVRLPMGYFEERGSGRLRNLLTDQVENIEKPLAHVLPELTANLLAPLAMMVWMFFIDWRVALAALIWIIAGFMVTGGMMKDYQKKFEGQIEVSRSMDQAVTEYAQGIEVIKNFGRAEGSCEKYEKAVYDYAEYNIGWQKETQVFSALGMSIAPFSIFPVLTAGLIFYSSGTLDIPSIILMALLSMGIFGPIMQASGYFDQLAQMGTLAKEIREVLDHPEVERGDVTEASGFDITYDHVSFAYGNGEEALKDVSFTVPEGTMLALVGPSGSGKSTIARLLAGYWDPGKGEITIGGRRMGDYTQEALNGIISYVDQDTFLFDETIGDNIRIGRPEACDDEVKAVAAKAGCDGFISALPEGYDTEAGSSGCRLSGGEKQRITIARAMMKDAPVMILDEATAGADPENEAMIQEALNEAARGRTLIVVAHHLNTIVDAQQIAYVEDGRIEAVGDHETMLAECEGYAALWAAAGEGR